MPPRARSVPETSRRIPQRFGRLGRLGGPGLTLIGLLALALALAIFAVILTMR